MGPQLQQAKTATPKSCNYTRKSPARTAARKPQSMPNNSRKCSPNWHNPIQPLEPMLLPKLRICFADFPWSHCSIDQRLFTSESGCGYRYGRAREGSHICRTTAKTSLTIEELQSVGIWISGRAFVRIVKAPRTAQKSALLSLCVQKPFST